MKKFSNRLYYLIPLMLVLITLAALSACSAYTTPTPTPTPTPSPTPTPAPYTINIASKAGIGDYLVDGKGMTLYYFTKDAPGKSNATAAIIVNWPIFYASNIAVPPSLNAMDFGSITGANGNMQSTYKGWPLYYYIKDQAPGDTLGQDINGVWFVINPANFPPTPTPTPTPTLAPSITITSPTGNIIPQIGNVTVSVQVSNFTLIDKLGQANVPGEGHIHYFMDVDAPTTPAKPAVTAAGTYAATAATSYTWHNVGGGPHKFSVELVNNDHTPLVPPVVATVSLTVLPEIGTPQVVITQPKDGAVVPAGDVMASVQVSNFNLADKLGQANVSHEGHIHYFLDVTPPTTQSQPAVPPAGSVWAAIPDTSYTFKNVTAGTHTISVELVNNDHTPLNPPVVTSITITVQAPTTTPTPSVNSVTITLVAKNIAFDQSTITVPAGASVTMNFDNKDSIPHNFALYTDSSASKAIFIGQIISASSITYKFTAPTAPGTYFFRCDVHPTTMTGSFVVQ